MAVSLFVTPESKQGTRAKTQSCRNKQTWLLVQKGRWPKHALSPGAEAQPQEEGGTALGHTGGSPRLCTSLSLTTELTFSHVY